MSKLLLSVLLSALSYLAIAQVTAPKIVVVNGGRFEFSPPFQDFVTVGVYDRATRSYNLIDTINDQSVQDVIVYGKGSSYFAYVLSQTTVTAYNLTTGQKVAQVTGLLGGSKLGFQDQDNFSDLIVTRGFGTPAGQPYVLVLDKNTLATKAAITGISDECSHIVTHGTKAYVSVPGNFLSTTGSLAVIDLVNNRLEREIQISTAGKGIERLFYANGNILAICNGGFGSTIGNVLSYNIATGLGANNISSTPISNGVGVFGGNLYARFTRQDGIGIGNINTTTITDSLLVKTSFATARLDTITNQIITTDAAYTSAGKARMFNLTTGAIVDSFQVGISPEAIAIAYYNPSLTNLAERQTTQLDLYPNPTKDLLYVSGVGQANYQIVNSVGTQVLAGQVVGGAIDVRILSAGVYRLVVGTVGIRFVKE